MCEFFYNIRDSPLPAKSDNHAELEEQNPKWHANTHMHDTSICKSKFEGKLKPTWRKLMP